MDLADHSGAALAIIENWGWDRSDPRFEFEVPLMMPLSEVINRLAMEGHPDAPRATLSLLATGKLGATGSYQWKAFRNGHFQREGIGPIPVRRWMVLKDGYDNRDPTNGNEITLSLMGGDWDGTKESRAEWDWNSDRFSTAEKSDGHCFDAGYSEEIYRAADIELRPASADGSDGDRNCPRQSVAERNRGGAPTKYDWEQAVAAVVFEWSDDGTWTPASQADVSNKLASWFAKRDEHPSDSALKERARWLFREFQCRATEGNNSGS
jgi:hypothetical protein